MASEPNNNSTTTPNGNSDTTTSTLTLRMIMQGKEAGSIIGKKGDNVKKFREESGAKINISDSSCPERIVTVTGTTDQIFKAFNMICKKFEEQPLLNNYGFGNQLGRQNDIFNTHQNSTLPKPPVTVRLIIPASQCGSLIGKGGSKIKEIREVTGASIQVASEMLPNSTERAVTISGTADAITQCIYHICCVMIESPPKGATIPYRPKPAVPPVIFAGGQAFTVQQPGQYSIPQPDPRTAGMVQLTAPPPQPHLAQVHHLMGDRGIDEDHSLWSKYLGMAALPHHHKMQMQGLHMAHAPGAGVQLMAQPGLIPATSIGAGMMPAAPFPRHHVPGGNTTQTHEMTIPNDLIGCIIGRGGAKINEIRQLSGATIKIANADEGSSDRKVTIMGTPETINAAQYLINASLEMHKQLNPELAGLSVGVSTSCSAVTSSPGAGGTSLQHNPMVSATGHLSGALAAPLKAFPAMHGGATGGFLTAAAGMPGAGGCHMSAGLAAQAAAAAAAAAAAHNPNHAALFDTLASHKALTTKLKQGAIPMAANAAASSSSASSPAAMVQNQVKKNGNKFTPY